MCSKPVATIGLRMNTSWTLPMLACGASHEIWCQRYKSGKFSHGWESLNRSGSERSRPVSDPLQCTHSLPWESFRFFPPCQLWLKGDAQGVVQGLAVQSENYRLVMETQKQKYGRADLVKPSLHQQLQCPPPVSKSRSFCAVTLWGGLGKPWHQARSKILAPFLMFPKCSNTVEQVISKV